MTTDAISPLYRLLTWLSPAYPVGAFSYSQGLETAVTQGLVNDETSTEEWIEDSLTGGTQWSDAVIFASAMKAPAIETVAAVNEFALAFPVAAELRAETLAMGRAFAQTTMLAWPCDRLEAALKELRDDITYPVAVACAAAGHGIDKAQATEAWIHAGASNLVSAAVRLVPLGQTAGQRILARLEPTIVAQATAAGAKPLEDLATSTLLADICAMNHETQKTRLFRS